MAYLDGALNVGGLPYILNIGGHVGPYESNHDDLALIQVLAGVAYGGANAPNMNASAKNRIDACHTWPSTFDWVLEEALLHCSKYVVGSGYTRHGSLSPATREKPGIVAALNVMAYNRNRYIWEAIAHEIRNGGGVNKKKHAAPKKSHGHQGSHGKSHNTRIHVF